MRKKKNQGLIVLLLLLIVTIALSFLVGGCIKSCSGGEINEPTEPYTEDTMPVYYEPETEYIPATTTLSELEMFAQKNGLSLDEWPKSLVEFMEKYPQTTDFVLNYPLLKDNNPEIDLSEHLYSESVPLFMQWDSRWGYTPYGDDFIANAGCGPTCLSMVCVYLLDDPYLTPKYIAEFSEDYGYCIPGDGSSWTLISEGGEYLGLYVEEVGLDEELVAYHLLNDHPIICVVGPGDFTDGGHFIVMTDYIDGKIKINDPNSLENSEKLWEFSDIAGQINNMWACSTWY